MARAQAVSLPFIVAKQRTAELTKALLVHTAVTKHRQIMRTEPRPDQFLRVVDGRQGAVETAVKPFGVIHYEYDRVEQVVAFAMDTLFRKSPVRSGRYRRSHTLFMDGVAVTNLRGRRIGAPVVITNFQPYARMIELATAPPDARQGRRMHMRVSETNRVYRRAFEIVRGRYGNLVRLTYTWKGVDDGSIVGGVEGNLSDLRFPALVIVPNVERTIVAPTEFIGA